VVRFLTRLALALAAEALCKRIAPPPRGCEVYRLEAVLSADTFDLDAAFAEIERALAELDRELEETAVDVAVDEGARTVRAAVGNR
jgi:hypothetical protein